MAQSQLENSNNLWKPLITPNKDNPAILYYKSQEINYFNKILLSVIIALSISLCALPLIIFMFRDFYSLSDSIDNLQHYLDSTKEKLENIKDTQTVHNFDNTKEADKLYKKLTESKNKRIILQHELERKNTEIFTLKENLAQLKADFQNANVENKNLDDEKTNFTKKYLLMNRSLK